MSVTNFKPEIWSTQINVALKNSLVYAALGNRDYEGQIKASGDTVRVNELAPLSTADYTTYSDITFSQLESAQKELKVDQKKYIAKSVDNVDAAQSNVNFMSTISNEMGYAFADTLDAYIAGLYAQAGITNATYLGSAAVPIEVNSANIDDYFVYAFEVMSDNNVPKQGRFAVVPPWVSAKLNLNEISSLTDNKDAYRNGFVGRAFGFDFYESNNVSEASAKTNSKILMGVKGRSWAVAEQILELKAGEHEKQFGDYVKGLHVYGAKIMRPDMTACGYITKKAEA